MKHELDQTPQAKHTAVCNVWVVTGTDLGSTAQFGTDNLIQDFWHRLIFVLQKG